MSAHTPGPWTIGDTHNYMRRSIEPGIGIVFGAGSGPDANARLIAAAPELLAALKHLVRYDFGDSEGAKEARAVIAKAEGREG